jgi:hypothetical protein
MTSCGKCGTVLESRAATKCPVCGRKRSHRDCYPEQYRHSLVGRPVVVRSKKGTVVTRGKVERVVSTQFGLLAHLDTSGETAYLVSSCIPED